MSYPLFFAGQPPPGWQEEGTHLLAIEDLLQNVAISAVADDHRHAGSGNFLCCQQFAHHAASAQPPRLASCKALHLLINAANHRNDTCVLMLARIRVVESIHVGQGNQQVGLGELGDER